MTKQESRFPWTNYYGNFHFFEDRMKNHKKVDNISSIGNGLYEILWRSKNIRVFVCDCYSYGVAEYLETKQIIGHVDAIVVCSAWNSYTYDAKWYCREQGVGVFKVASFMSALHQNDLANYLEKHEEEYFKSKGAL
jgi:hypothetical protein